MSEKTLNRQIAEELGWTNLYDAEWVDDELSLTMPIEQRIVHALCGTSPDGQHDCIVPDYEHSVDAVLAELPELPSAWFDMVIYANLSGDYSSTIREDDPPFGTKQKWEGRGTTRASAAARALLAYAQWKQAQA